MKICWDNLEKIRLTRNGNFKIGKGSPSYYEYDACAECGEPYLGVEDTKYCSYDCVRKSELYKQKLRNSRVGFKFSIESRQKMSETRRGLLASTETKRKMSELRQKEKHPNWKGGYFPKNIPLYDTYAPQLEPYEQCRRSTGDSNILEVKCVYCGKWFVPFRSSVQSRIKFGIKGNDGYRLYCSDTCKHECPIFAKKKYYRGQEGYNSREVQPELRQLVFERDNWNCQKCGLMGALHCHHIDPVASNPIESADIDNCVTLCKSCHKEVHSKNGCKYSELRKCA